MCSITPLFFCFIGTNLWVLALIFYQNLAYLDSWQPFFYPYTSWCFSCVLSISLISLLLSVLIPIMSQTVGDMNSRSQTLTSLGLFFLLNKTRLAHDFMFQGYLFCVVNIYFLFLILTYSLPPHRAMKCFHFSSFHCGLDKGIDELSRPGLFVSFRCW